MYYLTGRKAPKDPSTLVLLNNYQRAKLIPSILVGIAEAFYLPNPSRHILVADIEAFIFWPSALTR